MNNMNYNYAFCVLSTPATKAAAVYNAWITCDGDRQDAGLKAVSAVDPTKASKALDAVELARSYSKADPTLHEAFLKAAFLGAWSDVSVSDFEVALKRSRK
jgi:hypothetical protein